MATYRIDLSYDGSGFRGYACQDGERTIQEVLEFALETVLRSEVTTAVAGRTDSGVHAYGQVVSFEFDGDINVNRLRKSLNGLTGKEISVRSVDHVDDGFNARFSAKWRRYRYVLSTQTSDDPLMRHVVWHVHRSLDLEAMKAVGEAFVGQHDFTSFCRSVDARSNVRVVEEANWAENEGLYEFWVKSNSFCHQMVRSLVGYAYDVGRGFAESGKTSEVIEACDRSLVTTVAPSHGLNLWEVGY